MTVEFENKDVNDFFIPVPPKKILKMEEDFDATAKYNIITIDISKHSKIIEERIKKNEIKNFDFVPELPLNIKALEFLPNEHVKKHEEIVLCCHGWEGRGLNFFKFIPKLQEKGFRVLALDFPLHGHSKGGCKYSGCTVFGHTLNAVIRELNQPIYIIAHSMGNGAFEVNCRLSNQIEKQLVKKYVGIAAMNKYYDAALGHIKIFKLENEKELIKDYCEHKKELFGIDINDIVLEKDVILLDIPILFVHDLNDKEIDYEQTFVLKDKMKRKTYTINGNIYSSFHKTVGLGHRRILRDENVVDVVVNFLHEGQS
ncbi:alpha/beta-hydrolase [Anaeromyces robustus]|uniref:Alpha/beta-hydrolase n=1 Tax=Anaeromyces robustus TaxID=1754192 RepID=A0A1Y1VWU9_9FUNG|nr:alpha/beta-hydrolase [Anaeromyces robustus]|eukprot:ORX65769.1 alpha/beta-hydrolase [Anaeromyces robustus]